ncbi:MAG: hypothetical protein KAK00_00835 [Nanoarchaeota archaeon]|nr:hypothetical protein [Nanoarchaeota archaeon]
MATFLDVTGLEAFSKIFVFLLVLLVVYIMFINIKSFGDQKWIALIIAVVVGIFVILSDLATGIIRNIAPWFAVLFVFVIFITMASKIFGATTSDITEYKWLLFVIIILVFIFGSLAYVRQQTNVPCDVDEDGNEIGECDYSSTSHFIFHPKVLGIIFTLLVAVFTVALLAGKSS